MESLNTMSVDEISQNRERIITQIEANSKNGHRWWWAQVVAYADDTLTGVLSHGAWLAGGWTRQ